MAATSKRIILKGALCSYVNVFAPRQKMSGDGSEYSIQLILPKKHPQLADLKAAIGEVAKQAFPKKKLGTQVKVPDEIDTQRAREILEAIRRRLSDPERPTVERDYLERLLDRF